jgi:catechol 2,3-dioxygenase-like lactoylglutathione lyase family enzyme
MKRQIAQFSLVVRDYDDAIRFYTEKLGFDLIEDKGMGAGKRWVVVAPRGSTARLLLAKAASASQAARVGDQGFSFSWRRTTSSATTGTCGPAGWCSWRSRAVQNASPADHKGALLAAGLEY